MPKCQALVAQGVARLDWKCKHPIVTFLGRIRRSEERSALRGYDEQVLYRARDWRCAKTHKKNAEDKCQKSNGGRSSRC